MDGCLEGCAGCFASIVLFVIFLVIAYIGIGVFWIAFLAAFLFLFFIQLGKLTAGAILRWIDKKRK